MRRYAVVEDVGGPVARVVVLERPDAGHREPADLSHLVAVLVVPALDREREGIAGRNDDASRPDLDVELVDLAGREQGPPVVRVVWAVGLGQLGVERTVRGTQPAVCD